jgi:D-alanine-D-alanine ligase
MKIGILFQNFNIHKIPWQKNCEIYYRTAHRVEEMAEALIEVGHEVQVFSSLDDFLKNFSSEPVDIVFPCIECCFERNTNGFIPAILQMKGIPFVGNDSYINTIAADKYLFKNIANLLGINTPKSKLIYNQDIVNLSKHIHELKAPYIVKYRYGSMSYHTKKIHDFQELQEQINFMLSQNNGPVLCEEYIDGREISVPVIGNSPNEEIVAVVEYTDSGIRPLKIYDTFWKGQNDSQVELVAIEHSLPYIKKIICYVHRMYQYLNYHDYARFDFRLDVQGTPFLLEGNPLPALSYESAFDPISYGKNRLFSTILSKIVNSAAERYELDLNK